MLLLLFTFMARHRHTECSLAEFCLVLTLCTTVILTIGNLGFSEARRDGHDGLPDRCFSSASMVLIVLQAIIKHSPFVLGSVKGGLLVCVGRRPPDLWTAGL